VALAVAGLAVAGLVLGGYPGAVLLPAAVAVFRFPARGRRALSDPRLLGGLLAAALVVGAIGEHLLLSGDTGPFVTATANTIPQVLGLIIVAGLAAALLPANAERAE
jgi:hypothetical protein